MRAAKELKEKVPDPFISSVAMGRLSQPNSAEGQ
jgi:hypothetical protein